MRTRPVHMDDDCARSEFVVKDDGAASISVSNRKKEEACSTQKRFSAKARSDIGPLRESRDEVSSRAKKLWQQKSERRVGGAPTTSAHKPPAAPSPYRTHQRSLGQDALPRQTLEERMRATLGTRSSAPSTALTSKVLGASTKDKLSSRHSVIGVPLEEDTTPVDFRAARQLLIQRSKDNGNELKIASKVQRKASKFEQINKDTKRRASSTGLLKPTWESNAEAAQDGPQGPSTAYTKAFVEDIAPRRSFDDLP